MSTIIRHPLPNYSMFSLDLPLHASVIFAAEFAGRPCIWVRCDPHRPTVANVFHLTADEEPQPNGSWYMTSFITSQGARHLWGTLESSAELDRQATMRVLRRKEPVVQ